MMNILVNLINLTKKNKINDIDDQLGIIVTFPSNVFETANSRALAI